MLGKLALGLVCQVYFVPTYDVHLVPISKYLLLASLLDRYLLASPSIG